MRLYDCKYEDEYFPIFPEVDLFPSPACAVTTHSSRTKTVSNEDEGLSSHGLPDLDPLLNRLSSEFHSKSEEILYIHRSLLGIKQTLVQ